MNSTILGPPLHNNIVCLGVQWSITIIKGDHCRYNTPMGKLSLPTWRL